jgi:hypothetical protein
MEIFFGFCKKKLAIFRLCKKFSASGQNQRDERDYSAFGRGCVMTAELNEMLQYIRMRVSLNKTRPVYLEVDTPRSIVLYIRCMGVNENMKISKEMGEKREVPNTESHGHPESLASKLNRVIEYG